MIDRGMTKELEALHAQGRQSSSSSSVPRPLKAPKEEDKAIVPRYSSTSRATNPSQSSRDQDLIKAKEKERKSTVTSGGGPPTGGGGSTSVMVGSSTGPASPSGEKYVSTRQSSYRRTPLAPDWTERERPSGTTTVGSPVVAEVTQQFSGLTTNGTTGGEREGTDTRSRSRERERERTHTTPHPSHRVPTSSSQVPTTTPSSTTQKPSNPRNILLTWSRRTPGPSTTKKPGEPTLPQHTHLL